MQRWRGGHASRPFCCRRLGPQPAGLQPGQPVAAALAAEENRRLVADKRAAAVGQNGRATDQALQVLLAVVGRGTSAPASVCGHAAADCGAADAIGLALPLRLQNLEPKEEGRHSVGEIDYAATSGALETGKERAVGTLKSHWGLLWSQIS